MSIESITPQSAIKEYLRTKVKTFEKDLLSKLSYIGESAIRIAREKKETNDYTDRTGNLRNSTGYVIALDGEIVSSAGFLAGDGQAYAEELSRTTRGKAVLVVCAGMNYASYVSARGYDVLDSAELESRRLARALIATDR